MGEPNPERITTRKGRCEPREVKHLSTERNRKQQRVVFRANVMFVRMEHASRDSLSSGERNGRSPNQMIRHLGL